MWETHKKIPGWGSVMNWRQAKELTDNIRSRIPASKIVLANGTFDLLHPGHLIALNFARYQGSFLVVSVDDDETAHARGKCPVMPLADRMAMVAGLPAVGLVTTHGDDPGPFRHLDLPLHPHKRAHCQPAELS
jgi:cytidyltransferase-like protein